MNIKLQEICNKLAEEYGTERIAIYEPGGACVGDDFILNKDKILDFKEGFNSAIKILKENGILNET